MYVCLLFAGMVMANQSAVRPVSSRSTRPSSRMSTTSGHQPDPAVAQQGGWEGEGQGCDLVPSLLC